MVEINSTTISKLTRGKRKSVTVTAKNGIKRKDLSLENTNVGSIEEAL